MNALALLNNFEREFARPFFYDFAKQPMNSISSEITYDEKNSTWLLTAELAGVTKEQVKIDTDDSYLVISGEKTKGLNPGKFEARYHLPDGVDTEKVEALFEDGVLTLKLPLADKKRAKTIQIK